ncbi:hypothetical protein CPR19088_GLDEOEPO_01445 [Companilactobacillus paralimentarius]
MTRIVKPTINLLLKKEQKIAAKEIHQKFKNILRINYPSLNNRKIQAVASGCVGGAVNGGTLIYINNGKTLYRIK